MDSKSARCALLERRFLQERRLRQLAEQDAQNLRLELMVLKARNAQLNREEPEEPIHVRGIDGEIVQREETNLKWVQHEIGVEITSSKIVLQSEDIVARSETFQRDNLKNDRIRDDGGVPGGKTELSTDDLRAQYGNLKTTLAELKDELAEAKRRATAYQAAQEKVAQLQRERDQLQPLLQIGVRVRLRFLEQARETLYTVPRAQVLHGLILDGNMAAHNGSGKADALLFKHSLIEPELKLGLSEVFMSLYRSDPMSYGTWSPYMLDAIDHEVTIRMLRTVNDGLNRPLSERLWALEHIEYIRQKFQKKDRIEFEADSDVTRRLLLVKELVEKIVSVDMRSDRASNSGRSNPVTPNRPVRTNWNNGYSGTS